MRKEIDASLRLSLVDVSIEKGAGIKPVSKELLSALLRQHEGERLYPKTHATKPVRNDPSIGVSGL